MRDFMDSLATRSNNKVKRSVRACLASLVPVLFLTTAGFGIRAADAQVNVTTWHNDNGRTGQNLNETILNTSNVTASTFGKLFSQPVDGQIYAQPLYVSGVTINGAVHNVVYVATEGDSVYAFDADSNGGANASPLWKASMLATAHGAAAGATTLPSTELGTDINPQVGITGTPVIDTTTNTMYVVSATVEGGASFQRLHALDITTGLEKFGGPVKITATVAGTGNGSVNGQLTFDQMWENQRPGLLLLNGIVWIGFSSHGDNGPWHGWVIGYKASTLAQTGAYCTSPNGTGAGIWGAGAGLAADQLDPVNKPFGRMFIPTGNGDYTATKPYTNNMDYGDSQVTLDLTNGVPTVTDEFTTNTQAALNSQDNDVASGGLMVIPTQTGTYPNLAVQTGKVGTMTLLNRDNMGGYNTSANQDLQEQAYSVGNVGVWSTPAYFNNNIYYWGRFDYLKSFPLANGKISTTPTKSINQYGYPGATPSISANGSTNGIVWTIDSEAYTNNGPAVLEAHSAANVATALYSTATNPTRDQPGNAVKFSVPTISNGKVYVGAAAEVDIYGLLNGASQTAAPSFSPGTESFSTSATVTITDSTPNATIYYTTDGTQPTAASTIYTAPLTVKNTTTLNAIASATGMLVSTQSTATYTNVSQTAAVTFSLPTGSYGSAQTVTLSDSTANAVIYYTTDGSTPTTGSAVYASPLAVNQTETITAIAVAPGLAASPALAQTYTITVGATGIQFGQGFAGSAGLVILNGSSALNDQRLQLTSGATGQAGSAWYFQRVNVQTFTTDFSFQLSNPVANGITFAIQNASAGIYALGGNAYELGYAPIANSLAIKFDLYNSQGEGINSTGLYLNGAVPTVPSIDLSNTPINLHSDDLMSVHLVYDGTTLTMTITDVVTAGVWSTSWTVNIPNTIGSTTAFVGFTGSTGGSSSSQKIMTWSYSNNANTTPTVATPTFSVAGGTYTTAQTVSLADTTSVAKIYYTTNGTAPTTASTLYSGPITVSASETIEAIGAASGYNNSAVATAAYTISAGTVATPTFSVAAGSYTTAQTVSLADTTTGAKIYYTLNGTTPTTASTLYSGAITVSASETIEAIAAATGYTNSAVATAAYTITSATAATPTYSLPAGTYSTAQTTTIADATAGATIYYTLDGTIPTTASPVYSGTITISKTENLKAIAVATGYTNSAVAQAAYFIQPVLPTPTFSVAAGTYSTAQTVSLADSNTSAKIYYTLNGTAPTAASTLYSGAITVSASETIEAIAVLANYTNSAVATAAYTIGAGATPVVNFPTFTSSNMNLYGATVTGGALQLTDGGTGEARIGWYQTPVNVQKFTTDFTFTETSANADGFTFTLQNAPAGVWAVGGNGANLAYNGITKSVAVTFNIYNTIGKGNDAVGFSLNGATPETAEADITASGVVLRSGDLMRAHLTYDGTTLTLVLTDTVTSASYTASTAVNIPTQVGANTAYAGFTGSTGGLTSIQKINSWTYTVSQ